MTDFRPNLSLILLAFAFGIILAAVVIESRIGYPICVEGVR